MTLFAHLIGLALEEQVGVINLAFGGYRGLFPAIDEGLLDTAHPIRLGPRARAIEHLMSIIQRVPLGESSNRKFAIRSSGNSAGGSQVDEEFIEQCQRSTLFLTTGWNVTAFHQLTRHVATVRSAFDPHQTVRAAVEECLGNLGHSGRPLVGLHVRRCDYRRWEGGRFFWTDEQYLTLMDSLLEQDDFAFVITTDEPQSIGACLTDHPSVTLSRLKAVEDLHLLSRCDLILGPPSTFSTWASFHGGVPLLHALTPESGARLADFHVMAPQFVHIGKPLRRLSPGE